jgi:Xanthosine triphosphate pyrophosphatase
MDKIIFATGNEHKMIEIRAILSDLGVEILSQKEAGIKADVIEDGMTFEENAMIKATEIAKIAHEMPEYAHAVVLADDSGLEIDYLNKEPGIYSARYMGEDTSYDIKNQALLDRLDGVPDEKRTARFVCAIAAAMPDGCCEVVRGTIKPSRPELKLLGHDGNIFSILGDAARLLRRAGMSEQANEMADRVHKSSNYYEALGIISEYVETELSDHREQPRTPRKETLKKEDTCR